MKTPKCDQCDSATINGVYCHEHGCPNRHKAYDHDNESWVAPDDDSDDPCSIEYESEQFTVEAQSFLRRIR